MRSTVAGAWAWLRAAVPLAALPWLLVSVLVALSIRQLFPQPNLESGWMTGLNWAREQHLRFGSDLLFTYGPWGVLDVPSAISRRWLVLGLVYRAGVAALLWTLLHRVLVGQGWRFAPVIATATTVIALSGPFLDGMTGGVMVSDAATAGVVLAGYLAVRRGTRPPLGLVALFAVVAALLVQVKFSGGFTACLVTGLVALWLPGRLRSALTAVGSFVVATAAWWWLAGQSLGDFLLWFRGSAEIAVGYAEAQAVHNGATRTMVFAFLVIVSVLVCGWFSARRRRRDVWSAAGATLVLAVGLAMEFKGAFTRFDVPHQRIFFTIVPVLVVAVLPALHWLWLRAGVLAVVLVVASPNVGGFDPVYTVRNVAKEFRLVLDDGYRNEQLDAARGSIMAMWPLDAATLARLGQHPVHVDPLDVTLAWAYRLTWSPAVVLQAYSAYTPYLDERDAEALRDAPEDQLVLRASEAIDGRNPLWETPDHVRELICGYRPEGTDGAWTLLAKLPESRCGEPTDLGTVDVVAGQTVTPPQADDGSLVLMSYRPAGQSLRARLQSLLAVPSSSDFLYVATDGQSWRLPRALADQGLIVALPSSSGWTLGPEGGSAYGSVTVPEAGTITYTAVPVLP